MKANPKITGRNLEICKYVIDTGFVQVPRGLSIDLLRSSENVPQSLQSQQ